MDFASPSLKKEGRRSQLWDLDGTSFDLDIFIDNLPPLDFPHIQPPSPPPPTLDFDSLPLELWIRIFSDPILLGTDRKSLTLCCKLFQHVVQPMLFAKVAICWHHYKETWDIPKRDNKVLLELLDFLTSKRIVGHVRFVAVYVSSSSMLTTRQPNSIYEQYVLEPIFQALLRFPNLSSLDVDCLYPSPSRIAQLALLSSLMTLNLRRSVDGPRFPSFAQIPKLRSLFISGFEIIPSVKPVTPWWIPLLSSTSVEDFRITDQDYIYSCMPIILHDPLISFPSVRSLEINDISDHPDFWSLLSRFPSIESLRITSTYLNLAHASEYTGVAPPKQDLKFPQLRNISATLAITTYFLRNHPDIWCLDVSEHEYNINPELVKPILQGCPRLVSLTIRSAVWRGSRTYKYFVGTMSSILGSLTCLKTLRIHSPLENSELYYICESLYTSPPPLSICLESFMLTGGALYASGKDITSNFVYIPTLFRRLYPNLRDFFMSSASKYIIWPGPIGTHPELSGLESDLYEHRHVNFC